MIFYQFCLLTKGNISSHFQLIYNPGIRTIQCVLLKIALILGVKLHFPVTFVDFTEPQSPTDNWRISVEPKTARISGMAYDAIICADGKQHSLKTFHSKEFRAKLAIAITANFVNSHTDAEVAVEEISGVAFIYNQAFFKSLSEKHGIDLENIVYYKDETHYFVMTAKKGSLLSKGVLKKVSCLLRNFSLDTAEDLSVVAS